MTNIQNIADQISKCFIGLRLSAIDLRNRSAILFYASLGDVQNEFLVSSILHETAIVRIARSKVMKLYPAIKMPEFFENIQSGSELGEKLTVNINELKQAQQRIEAAQHALNDEIRKGGLIGLNTSVRLQNVVDQNGSRDIVFVDCRVSPHKIES